MAGAEKPRFRVRATAAGDVLAVSASSYDAGGVGGEAMALWSPRQRPADAEILRERGRITGRARDLARNDGYIAGGTQREIDAVIGGKFRPKPRPDWRALGLEPEWAAEWSALVEARWRAYADDPRCYADATRSLSAAGMIGLGYRSYVIDGEALGVLDWNPDRPVSTVLRVIDPDLLENPAGSGDRWNLRGGVELDDDGAAVAYHFRASHRGDMLPGAPAHEWTRWPRETEWGRPVVVHCYDKQRDGQTRGVSRLAPIIARMKQGARYGEAEVQAAILNAVLAAVITSPFDHSLLAESFNTPDGAAAVGDYQEIRSAYREANPLTLGGVRVPMLVPGEKLEMQKAERPAAGFPAFESQVLRHVASGLGISYEQLSSDYSRTNYSSARAAMLEIWRGWSARRTHFAAHFCQPWWMAWLEEEVDAGRIPLPPGAPDFHENWTSYAACKWIGPGKGFVDPVKEAQAAAMRVSLGFSTLEDEAAELTGSDIEANFAQIEREMRMMPRGMIHPASERFATLIGPEGVPEPQGPNGDQESGDSAAGGDG